MEQLSLIVADIKDGLVSIPKNILDSLWNDFLFPPPRPTSEEQLRSKVKGQHGVITSLQGEVAYLIRQSRSQARENQDLNQHLAQKDKELVTFRRENSSLRWQLQEERNRTKRLR